MHPHLAEFRGQLLRPGDTDYDGASLLWNSAFDARPALIARVAGADDVARALAHAQAEGLIVAVRGGGHSLAGHSSVEGGLVIDLSEMRGVEVDPVERTAVVEAGCRLADVDAATAPHGLAVPAGQISHTGVAGLTLGGGIGWLMREHGLTIDNLLQVEIVTTAGRVLRANGRENADLFWAVRGGGGNFGVVTRFKYRLRPVKDVLAGPLVYALDDAPMALRAWRTWTSDLPRAMGAFAILAEAPPAPEIPEAIRGKPALFLAACWNGDAAEGDVVLAPLRKAAPPAADLVRPMPFVELQRAQDETVPYGRPYYARSAHLGSLADEAIDRLVDAARAFPFPGSQLHLGLMGGAIGDVSENATAYSDRDAPYTLVIHTGWTREGQRAAAVQWARDLSGKLDAFAKGMYVNHVGDDAPSRVTQAYGEAKLARLRALKRRYDPGNVLRRNTNIAPS